MSQRKYFGTDGIRGRVGTPPISADFVLRLGHAAGKVLARGAAPFVIGKDTRISGYMFESALEAGLSAAGANVRLLGPMPTPAVAYLTQTMRGSAGIVISASHNPYSDNGFKFFSSRGEKLADEVELEIERKLDEPFSTVAPDRLGRAERVDDAAGRYIEFCKATISRTTSLKDLHIVVDCANGANYHVGPMVLRELGARVTSIAASPNGLNINEGCGSTSMGTLRVAVAELQADLGIAFDGDGDRMLMVDHTGAVVDGDELMFVMARALKRNGKLGGGVAGTLMSNLGLEQALEALGVSFVRTQVGDRYVLQELVARGWILGGETSGHIIRLDKTTTGDGMVSALAVLEEVVESELPLAELRRGMEKCPQVMINVPVNGPVDLDRPALSEAVRRIESELGDDGRVILRPSGTEPVVRVTLEGRDQGTIQTLAERLAGTVQEEFGG